MSCSHVRHVADQKGPQQTRQRVSASPCRRTPLVTPRMATTGAVKPPTGAINPTTGANGQAGSHCVWWWSWWWVPQPTPPLFKFQVHDQAQRQVHGKSATQRNRNPTQVRLCSKAGKGQWPITGVAYISQPLHGFHGRARERQGGKSPALRHTVVSETAADWQTSLLQVAM